MAVDNSLEDGARELLASTVYREGEDRWAEWTVQLGSRADLVEPTLLGVRCDLLLTIIEGRATSHNPGARFAKEEFQLSLTYDMAMWLLDVLPKAISHQYGLDVRDDAMGTAAEPELISRKGIPTAPAILKIPERK